MRSLSLESILVNKNMKLLILLVTLLVQTNFSLSRPTVTQKMIFGEILEQLDDLKTELNQPDLKAFIHSVPVKLPHNIKNVCECEEAFVRHLKTDLMSVNGVLRINATEQIQNILDNLNNPILHEVKMSSASCNFTEHTITHIDPLIKKSTGFIQNWNSHCAPKKN